MRFNVLKLTLLVLVLLFITVVVVFWVVWTNPSKILSPSVTNIQIPKTISYTHPKLGFTLQIPESWKGKYIVQEESSEMVRFDYIGVSTEYTPALFAIIRMTETDYQKYLRFKNVGLPPRKIINTEDGYIYTYNVSLDNPYTDEKSKQEYGRMINEVDKIISSFSL